MPTQRIWYTGCVFDGKIYIIGGISPSDLTNDPEPKGLDIVERYDPDTDTWDTCAPMITGRFVSTACTLNDSLFVLGGIKEKPGNWPGLTSVEAYDPRTDTWVQKANMHIARTELTNVILDGKIYALGGFPDVFGRTVRSNFEVYDPGTDTWILHDDPEDRHPQGTAYHTIGVDGRIYALNAVGPYGDFHPIYPEVYVYNKPLIKVLGDTLFAGNDSVVANVLEACTIYIVQPGTPAKWDSIIGNSIVSYEAHEIREYDLAIDELPPGSYRIYAVSLDGRIDLNYFQFRILPTYEGVSEQANQMISIYPNPTQDLITIQTMGMGSYSLEIISLNGQVLMRRDFPEWSVQVDMSSLSSGIYLIRIISKDDVCCERIVKY
jgi:hypothetical protein